MKKLLSEKNQVLLAIDGPCASGKTTLAERIALEFDGNLIHMDDFFLRPQQRTAERFAEAGGNVDRERFLEEVLLPIKKGKPFSYRPFDCGAMALGKEVQWIPKKLTVVEGSYSMHPYFGDPYDLTLFLEISPEEQLARLKKRSPEKLDRFLQEWIPMENRYFQAFSVKSRCNFVLD